MLEIPGILGNRHFQRCLPAPHQRRHFVTRSRHFVKLDRHFVNQGRHFVWIGRHFVEDSLVVRGGGAWQTHPHLTTSLMCTQINRVYKKDMDG